MVFTLESAADTPLYVQIREGLRREIATGALAPGTRLPSSRQLATDLGVSRITTATAYAELEADGLVEARAGSGTFVLPAWRRDTQPPEPGPADTPEWQRRLEALPLHPDRQRMMRESVRAHQGELIPFAWARGDVRLFPTAEFRRTLGDVVELDGTAGLQYERSEGNLELRQAMASYLVQLGVPATVDEVIITAGAQQAIDLLARAILRPGDRVAVEEPTYPGALQSFEAMLAEPVPVPLDAEGMRADALARALEGGARLVYTVPTFHNPTGTVMSAARRREVVALASRFGVPVIEDDYLREVRFGSPIPPPLAAFDCDGNVVHVGSFSKSLLPALRLGYVVARGPLRERVVGLKHVADAGSSALLQRALCRHLASGSLHGHWKRASRIYRRRQSAMSAALRRHFPPGCSWDSPDGGVVMWVRVPDGTDMTRLFDDALAQGVSFALGSAFFTQPADQPFMRLNFAALEEERIERGIAVLGRLLGG